MLESLCQELNALWKDVLIYWTCDMKFFTNSYNFINKTFHYIPVWYKSYIKVGNKAAFIKLWQEKGINVVQYVFDYACNHLVFGVL